MDRAVFLTIRNSGGGAEKVIANLCKMYPGIFTWVNAEDLLHCRYFVRLVFFWLRIYRECQSADVVIIGVEGAPAIYFMPVRLLLRRKKIFLWIHCHYPTYKKFLSIKQRFIIALSLTVYRNKISASPALEGSKFIPNPVEPKFKTEQFGLGARSFCEPNFVIVGSLAPLKNIKSTLTTLSSFEGKYTIQLFGDGPQKFEIENLIETLGIRCRILHFGFADEPWRFVSKKNSVLVVNSLTEAMPTVIIEALLNHIPVILRDYVGAEYWQAYSNVHMVRDLSLSNINSVLYKLGAITEKQRYEDFTKDVTRLQNAHNANHFIDHIFAES